jgi:hypothetical protein
MAYQQRTAAAARPPYIGWQQQVLSARTGKADGRRAHPWLGWAESDGGEVARQGVAAPEDGAHRGPCTTKERARRVPKSVEGRENEVMAQGIGK